MMNWLQCMDSMQ